MVSIEPKAVKGAHNADAYWLCKDLLSMLDVEICNATIGEAKALHCFTIVQMYEPNYAPV